MKVSRKVGRRKHSRGSSVSRRRLRSKKSRSGYKKRYAKTHKGGARSRKYGHKRGKRFHRGGDPTFDCNFTEIDDDNYKLTIPTNQQLYVKKNGEYVQGKPTQEFKVILSVKKGRKFIQDLSTSQSSTPTQFVVTFERTTTGKDGRSVSFSISDLSYFTDKDKQKETKRFQNKNETYDFSNSENQTFFIAIQACIQDQLLKQKQELKDFYDEVKDLLEHCKIVILSSMEEQTANVKQLTDNFSTGRDDWSKLHADPKPPFFSFLFFVYGDESGNIDTDKTKKLLELLSSLSNYGIFYLRNSNGQPYTETDSPLEKLKSFIQLEIKQKINRLVESCSKLLEALAQQPNIILSSTITEMFSNVKLLLRELKDLKYTPPGVKPADSSSKRQDLNVPPDKIWEVFTRIKYSTPMLVGLTDTPEITLDKLTEYVDGNADFFNGTQEEKGDFIQRFSDSTSKLSDSTSKLSDKEKEKQKILNREIEVDAVITKLGENIEAHPNDTNSNVRRFSDFKQEQTSKAEELKTNINGLSIDEPEQETRKANVDFYLKKILETQLDYMKKRYRALYIYQDFPKPDNQNERLVFTSNNSGLDDDKVNDTLKKLHKNVVAFQFRMEKQAENLVSGEYSDLVSTLTDDSNYENLFAGCKIFSKDSYGNTIGNATECYKSLEYTPSMQRELS